MHEWMWLCKIVYVHIIGSPCEWHSIAFFSTSFGKCVCFFFRSFFFVSFSYSYSYFSVYAIIYSHNVYKTSKTPIPNMNVLICRNLLLNWVLQNCICYTRSYRRLDKTMCHCSGNDFFSFLSFRISNQNMTLEMKMHIRYERVVYHTRNKPNTRFTERASIRLLTKHSHIITFVWLMHCEWHDGITKFNEFISVKWLANVIQQPVCTVHF